MPRYVILRHELPTESGRPSHWDVMLEHRTEAGDVVLRTWAIERSPDETAPQPATHLPDHRAAYLTYEGPISGGRGEVTRWDEGTFTATTTDKAIEIIVEGRRLRGRLALARQAKGELDRYEYRYAAASDAAG